MSILDDPKVWQIFGCGHEPGKSWFPGHSCREVMALHVIEAMEEPIRDGEKMMVIQCNGENIETTNNGGTIPAPHYSFLRLPDVYQPKDQVEEKIKQIMGCRVNGMTLKSLDMAIVNGTGIEFSLRELVGLVEQRAKGQ